MKRLPISKWIVIPIVVVSLFIAAGSLHRCKKDQSTSIFRNATVKRGDLRITISATGTIEPEEVIDVGAQVAGKILSFGKDNAGKSVDYGSEVSKGMVLARIDDSLYAAEAAIAQAELEAAMASRQRAEADNQVFTASFKKAERDWQRAQKIGPSEALARSRYDEYQAAYEIGKANILVSEAAILQAKAEVAKARAALQRANRNVGYCTITSPVDGIIIDRRVDIGQTVVANLSAPSLFLLAKDLKRMQIWVAVNEADVPRIHPGQDVTFTIDALPDDTFKGKVGKIRLNAAMTQNVVIYTVEVITDNRDGKLLPYLTANVVFEIDKRENVLLVSNTAFLWKPTNDLIDPQYGDASSAPGTTTQTLWMSTGKKVRPLHVQIGLSDGLTTEVMGDSVAEGAQMVIGLQPKSRPRKKEKGDQNNPFMPSIPTPPGGGGSGGGGGGPQ